MKRNINCIKICAKIKKTPAETFFYVFVCMLKKAYGDESMSQSCVFESHGKFHEGQKYVQDDERFGSCLNESHRCNTENLASAEHLGHRRRSWKG